MKIIKRSFNSLLTFALFIGSFLQSVEAQTCPGFVSGANNNFSAALLGGFVNVTFTGDRTTGGTLHVDTFIPSFSVVSDPNNPNLPPVVLAPQSTSQEINFLPYVGPNYFEIPVFLVTFDSVALVFNVQEVAWTGVFDTGAVVFTGAADFLGGGLSLTLNNGAQNICVASPLPNPIVAPGIVFDIPLAIGLDQPTASLLAGIPKISNLLFIYDPNSIIFGAPAALAAGQAALATCTQNLTTEQGLNQVCQVSLGTCNTDLGTCNATLGTCNSDLSICNTNLGNEQAANLACQGSLATCNTNLINEQANSAGLQVSLNTCNASLGTCGTNLASETAANLACQSALATANGNFSACQASLLTSQGNEGSCQTALVTCQTQLGTLSGNSCPASTTQQLQQLASAKAQVDGIDVSNLRRSIALLNRLARARYSHSPASVKRMEATRLRALKLNAQNIAAMQSLEALKTSLGL